MNKLLEVIRLHYLYELYKTINESSIRNTNYIRNKYSETGINFIEHLKFSETLGIITNSLNELSIPAQFINICSFIEFKKRIILVLFSSAGEIVDIIRAFLINFKIENGTISFTANELSKIRFSGIRNLLLDLEFIAVLEDNSTYIINSDYVKTFKQQFQGRILSPDNLRKRQAETEKLSLDAEIAVIHYELNRLVNLSITPNDIEHTALINVLAGYDIRSFENYFNKNNSKIDRYIEVKAVSLSDYRFYWSRNEMEVAKVFGKSYYLYLLPVISNSTFAFEKMLIINNPYSKIYCNESEWEKTEESLSFTKKEV